jgi:hypothetical protein
MTLPRERAEWGASLEWGRTPGRQGLYASLALLGPVNSSLLLESLPLRSGHWRPLRLDRRLTLSRSSRLQRKKAIGEPKWSGTRCAGL